jgi:predicted metal-dependent HD superfamily phosphohydrolase
MEDCMPRSLLNSTKSYFNKTLKNKKDLYKLDEHVIEVERWVNRIMKKYPSADKEVILLSVWLHDVSYYSGDKSADHAIKSEKMAKRFLFKEKCPPEKIEKVCHCVRAHRNKDVTPNTIEAKILACADSASHMTWITYMDMLCRNDVDKIYGKIERDWRDIGLLPEIQKELLELYKSWLKLIKVYEKLNFKK